ncbi:hypothetical protein ACFPK5_01085 [Streptomyces beijiangensis]|uniref:hypothetical protein n=1 Tax=Streptomyces beijiangensis TaxID=163361 RepID=UPI00360A37CE
MERHCALALPDSQRFVDPTIEQFDEVRRSVSARWSAGWPWRSAKTARWCSRERK